MKALDFDGLVLRAQELSASDIHIQTGSAPHFRIHGDVVPAGARKISTNTIDELRSLILEEGAEEQIASLGSVDHSYTVHKRNMVACRLRVSFSKCREGHKVACRLIPVNVPTIEELGLPEIFKHIADQRAGMVILAGVTGAGKSTTLAAMIERINQQRRAHIVTIEDPVEFMHTPKKSIFTRREIGADVPTFADGLRTALRQDPDVILVGEMRDLESIRHGLVAAETGHLVFATVHSETVNDIPERIISTFPQGEQEQVRYQIADVGLAFIAQQLVKMKSGQGRQAAFEILVLNGAARNLIRTKKSHQHDSVMQTQVRTGCTTMTRDLIQLHQAGLIDQSSLIACAPNKERARKYAMEHVHLDTAEPLFFSDDYAEEY